MAETAWTYTGPERLVDLVADFLGDGGTIESIALRRGHHPWPEYRERLVSRLDVVRSELRRTQTPAEVLATEPTLREKAINSAIDVIDTGSHGLIARRHGEIVGVAGVTCPESGLLELEWVGTRPGGRGAGAALVAATIAGWPYPTALRLQSLPGARSFYLSLGFHDEGSLKMVLPAPRVAAALAELPRAFGLTPERAAPQPSVFLL